MFHPGWEENQPEILQSNIGLYIYIYVYVYIYMYIVYDNRKIKYWIYDSS